MTEPTRLPAHANTAPAAAGGPAPALRLSPTLQRIRAMSQGEPAKPRKKGADAEAVDPAQAAPAAPASETAPEAPAPADALAAPATPAPAAPAPSAAPSSLQAAEPALLSPLNAPSFPALQGLLGPAPLGAIGTGLALAAAAGGLGSGGKSAASDASGPLLQSARLNDAGTQLVLSYNESLSSSLPEKGQFLVTVDGQSLAVTAVARGSDLHSVVLTLASSLTSPQRVSVSLSDGAAVKDLAGNVAAAFRNQTLEATDKVAPTLQSSNATTSADGSVIVLRYSEDLSASAVPEAGSFSVSVNGALQTLSSIEVLGDTVRLKLATPVASPGSSTSVRLSYTQPADTAKALKDGAGNLVASTTTTGGLTVSHSQDSTAPTLGTEASSVSAQGLQPRTLRLTFNENLDAGSLAEASSFSVDVSSQGSTRSIPVSALRISGAVLELSLAEAVNDAAAGLRVRYTPPAAGKALQDWAGNDVAAFDRSASTPDAVAPSLVSSRFTSDKALELSFSETLASLGPDKSAFTLTANDGATLKPSAISISGKTLTLSFETAVQTGKAATLSYTAPASDSSPLNQALQDTAGNDLPSFSHTPDTTAPTLASAITSNDGTKILLTYNEALLAADSSASPAIPAVATSAFKVFKGTGSEVSVSSIGIAGKVVTLNLGNALAASDAVSVFYTPPASSIGVANAALQDASGNDAAALGSGVTGQAVTNDVRDVVSPSRLSVQAWSSAASTTLVLTYSEELLASALPSASAFTLTDVSGNTSYSVSEVAVFGRELHLRLANLLAGPLGLKLSYSGPANDAGKTNAALQDLAGNDAASFSSVAASLGSPADTTTPTLSSAATSEDGKQVTLEFSEALQRWAIPKADSFTLTAGGTAIEIDSLSVSGTTVTLQLKQRLHSLSNFKLSYADPGTGDDMEALQDTAGNDVASFNQQTVSDRVDRSAPSYTGATLKSSNVLTLNFDETLAGTAPDKSAFTVKQGTSVLSVTAVQLNGSKIELTLAGTLSSASGLSVSYSAPAADIGTGNAALQDSYGNDVASFGPNTLDGTPPTLTSAVTNETGSQVRLSFSETLSSTLPLASAFKLVHADGTVYSVSSVSASGSVLTLNIDGTLASTGQLYLSYTAPSRNDTAANAALQDVLGNDADSFGTGTPQAVANKVAPTLSKTLLDSQSAPLDRVVLTLSEETVGTLPDKSAFSVSLAGVAQAIDSVSRSGEEVILHLSTPIIASGSLQVSYAAPTLNPLQDSDGNKMASVSETVTGTVVTGASGNDVLNGTGQADHFLGSLGNDQLTGGGGTDVFVWPDFGASGPGGLVQTIKDFGFAQGDGSLQGEVEADKLDLRHLLDGYSSSATLNNFVRAVKGADGKLVLHIDHDGGTSFSTTATLVFDNVSIDASNRVLAGGAYVTHGNGSLLLSDVVSHLLTEKQLAVL